MKRRGLISGPYDKAVLVLALGLTLAACGFAVPGGSSGGGSSAGGGSGSGGAALPSPGKPNCNYFSPGNLSPGNFSGGNLSMPSGGNLSIGNLSMPSDGNLSMPDDNCDRLSPGNLSDGNLSPGNLSDGNLGGGNLSDDNLSGGNNSGDNIAGAENFTVSNMHAATTASSVILSWTNPNTEALANYFYITLISGGLRRTLQVPVNRAAPIDLADASVPLPTRPMPLAEESSITITGLNQGAVYSFTVIIIYAERDANAAARTEELVLAAAANPGTPPNTIEPVQLGANYDGDELLDSEDPDWDNDGFNNTVDPCPRGFQRNRVDTDNDGCHDLEDLDPAGEGVFVLRAGLTHEGEVVLPAVQWQAMMLNGTELMLAGEELGGCGGGRAGDAANCTGYKLGSDLDLGGRTVHPIGHCAAQECADDLLKFNSVFDGAGYTVSNFVIDSDGYDIGVGIFGALGGAAVIRDAAFSDYSFAAIGTDTAAGENVGGLVGFMSAGAVIERVQVSGLAGGLAAHSYVGGVVGFMSSGAVIEQVQLSDIAGGISGHSYLGGLVGFMDIGAQLEGAQLSSPDGAIAAQENVGGVVGAASAGSSISGVAAVLGDITAAEVETETHTGGLVGLADGARISDIALTLGYLVGGGDVGGLVGSGEGAVISDVTLIMSDADEDTANDRIEGKGFDVGGIIGEGPNARVSNVNLTIYDLIGRGERTGGIVGGGDNVRIDRVTVNFSSRIFSDRQNVGGLVGQGDNARLSHAQVTAGNLIGTGHIGGALGLGNGATMNNLRILIHNSITDHTNINGGIGGVVGRGDDASIRNVEVAVRERLHGLRDLGGLVGLGNNLRTGNANLTIKNLVSRGSRVGGVLGRGDGAAINNVNLNVTNRLEGYGRQVGGVLGLGDKARVMDAHVTIYDLIGRGANLGGIIGESANATIVNVTASFTARIVNTAGENTGGVLGQATNANISNALVHIALLDVRGHNNTGGLIGQSLGTDAAHYRITNSRVVLGGLINGGARVGGLVGDGRKVSGTELAAGVIHGSHTEINGDVSAGVAVGGLVGDGSAAEAGKGVQLHSSYVNVSGAMSAADQLGGLIGEGDGAGVINSYAAVSELAASAAAAEVDGLLGNSLSAAGFSVTNSYWNSGVSFSDQPRNGAASGAGSAVSLDNLRLPTEFSGIYQGWDSAWCSPLSGEFTTDANHALALAGGGDTYRAWQLGDAAQLPWLSCAPE